MKIADNDCIRGRRHEFLIGMAKLAVVAVYACGGIALMIELSDAEPEPERESRWDDGLRIHCPGAYRLCDVRFLPDAVPPDCDDEWVLDRWLGRYEITPKPDCFDRTDREHCLTDERRRKIMAMELGIDEWRYTLPIRIRERITAPVGPRYRSFAETAFAPSSVSRDK